MILEIDAGNTRIKWRLVREPGRAEKSGDMPAIDIIAEGSVLAQRKAPSVFLELGSQLNEHPLDEVSRMLVSNVRGEDFRTAFSSVMTEKWQLQPEFAVVEKQCGGVTNSYKDPGNMGVDRWLAILAAYNRAKGACCVMDCGSAITFDLVDGSGKHQGGFIVPGLHLMQDSLARKTPALDIRPEGWESVDPAADTVTAIGNGILAMVVGFAERCNRVITAGGEPAKWYLTGGDGEVISRHLDWPHRVEKDLVLDGLAIAMGRRQEA